MTILPRNRKKSRRRFVIVKIMLAAMLFVAVLPPAPPAYAGCISVCDAPATTSILGFKIADLQQLGVLGSILSSIFTFLSGASFIMQQTGYSAVTSAVNGSAGISMQMQGLVANFNAQAAAQQALLTEGAKMQAMATMSSQDLTCGEINYAQAVEALGQGSLGAALAHWVVKSCQGPNSDCSGPNQVTHFVNEFCQLGMLSTDDFGPIIQNCPQPKDPDHENLITKISYMLTQPMIAFPSGCIMQDGFIGFAPNDTNCQQGSRADAAYNGNVTQDKSLGAALFLACEMLYTAPKCVYGNRQMVKSDESKIMECMSTMGAGNQLMTDCFEAAGRRYAVPAGVVVTAGGANANTDYHVLQVAACTALKTAAGAPGGLGYTTDPVLNNCEQTGLSDLYREKVRGHCTDLNHTVALGTNIRNGPALSDRMGQNCQAGDTAFQNSLKMEAQQLGTEIEAAISAKMGHFGSDVPQNSSSRPSQ